MNRLTETRSETNGTAVVRFRYGYNAANQRTAVTNVDDSRWAFGYDGLGQLISGKKYSSNGTAVAGQHFEYSFDTIGNRLLAKAGGDTQGGNLRVGYYTNSLLNQVGGRSVKVGANN